LSANNRLERRKNIARTPNLSRILSLFARHNAFRAISRQDLAFGADLRYGGSEAQHREDFIQWQTFFGYLWPP
jgi:hypothetical protein